jgi:hypothetical protein
MILDESNNLYGCGITLKGRLGIMSENDCISEFTKINVKGV